MQSVPERSPSTNDLELLKGALGFLPLEAQVLLLSAGGDSAAPALRVLLGQRIDPLRLIDLAEREQATSILWARLSRLGYGSEAVGMALPRLAMVSEFNLLRLRQRLYETTDALTAAGITAVLLKGTAVAHSAYPSFAQRPMSDIDLLVPPEQSAAAQDVLLASGWIRIRVFPDEAYEGHQHLPPLTDARGSQAGLDLHRDLFFAGHPFRFSADAVRAGARRISVDHRVLLVPDLAHQLLYACLHFAYSHMMTQGAWRTFRDVAAIAGTGLIDWKEFVGLARESGGATCCYWTFRLAQATAGITVPEQVLEDLRPRLPGIALQLLERHFSLGLLPTGSSCPSVRLRNLMWRIGVFPDRSDQGSVRPWGRLRRFRIPSNQGGSTVRKGLSRHLSHALASPRYMCSVLGVTQSAAASLGPRARLLPLARRG